MLDLVQKIVRLGGGLVLAMALGTGCASNGDVVPAEECTVPPVANSEYLIGPGDTLEVDVWRNAELSATVPVRPDGMISTPLVEDMVAAGKTPSQLAADIETVLGEYLRIPDVSVIVAGQGVSNQIQIVGEVATPQSVSYHEGIRVLDIIVGAGGLNEFAAGNRASLMRPILDGQMKCRVKLSSLMDGDMTQNILVFPGDVLVVPLSRF